LISIKSWVACTRLTFLNPCGSSVDGETSLATNIRPLNVAKAYRPRHSLHDARKALSMAGLSGFYSLENRAPKQLAHGSCPKQQRSRRSRSGPVIMTKTVEFGALWTRQGAEACPLYIRHTPALPISQAGCPCAAAQADHG